MAQPTLLPDPTCLHLRLLDASTTAITAVVTTTSEQAECPLCHRRSARIHSRYVRTIADLPWMGWAVQLELHTRRFFCARAYLTPKRSRESVESNHQRIPGGRADVNDAK